MNKNNEGQPFKNQLCLNGEYRGKVLSEGHLQLYPNNCIGLVMVSNGQGHEGNVTGSLISSCTVLTSAHSFVFAKNGQLVTFKPFQFCLKVHGRIEQSVKVTVTDLRFPKQYLELCQEMVKHDSKSQKYYQLVKESIKYDYALLKIEKNIQRDSHPILCSGFQNTNQKVTVCGYSKEKTDDFRQLCHINYLQFEHSQSCGVYDIDTKQGQSGSPVYFTQKQKNIEKCYVIGIHKGYDYKAKKNVCTLFTKESVNQIQQWVDEMNLAIKSKNAEDISNPDEPFKTAINSEVLRLKGTMQADLQFLRKILNNPSSIRLLFRASEHDFKAQAFHKHCDDYYDTLILIRNEYGMTFGGYSHYKWFNDEKMNQQGQVSDKGRRTFLFQLDNRQKYLPVSDDLLIRGDPSHGPVFGGGTDLGVGEDSNTQINSWSHIGWTYKKEGQKGHLYEYDREGQRQFSGDDGFYRLEEYEVYQISWQKQG